jgi:ATP-binding cassette subfamily B protein
MTTVVISHRYATVRQADTICVLENGSIAESGDHAGLMRRKGIYSQLFAVQAASFDDEAADET